MYQNNYYIVYFRRANANKLCIKSGEDTKFTGEDIFLDWKTVRWVIHYCYSICFLFLQSFFPRGPAPRIANHRSQVVNMQPNNVTQQMYPQHVSFISPKKFFWLRGIHKVILVGMITWLNFYMLVACQHFSPLHLKFLRSSNFSTYIETYVTTPIQLSTPNVAKCQVCVVCDFKLVLM